MTATTNAENLLQCKIIFSLIADHIPAFASYPNIKIYVSKFQADCVTMFCVIECFHLDS